MSILSSKLYRYLMLPLHIFASGQSLLSLLLYIGFCIIEVCKHLYIRKNRKDGHYVKKTHRPKAIHPHYSSSRKQEHCFECDNLSRRKVQYEQPFVCKITRKATEHFFYGGCLTLFIVRKHIKGWFHNFPQKRFQTFALHCRNHKTRKVRLAREV